MTALAIESSVEAPSLATIVFNRMGFGPSPELSAEWQTLGPDDATRLQVYIDQQLNPDTIDDADCDQRLAAANLDSLTKSRSLLWRHYLRRELEDARSDTPYRECQLATFLRATYSKRQLFELITNFWHDHFSVHGSMSVVASMLTHYDRDVIRANAFGNFRMMLGAVARSTSMLYYLDNYTSSNAGPNENWARELFELHTLGEENYLGSGLQQSDVSGFPDAPVGYVDSDVYEATRCFTGWTVAAQREGDDSGEFLFRADWHDRFQKTVLGNFIPADQSSTKDGDDVLDALAAHPGTATFICRKLCKKLIADDPPEALIDSAAAIFLAQQNAPDQIKQVLQHILQSDAFQTTWGQKIKRPFAAIVGVLRATEADIAFRADDEVSRNLLRQYEDTGHTLFDWPAPNGYPDFGAYWLNTTSLFKRWRIINWLVAARNEDETPLLKLNQQLPATTRSSEAIVAYWSERLLGLPLSAVDRQALINFMAQGHNVTYDLPLQQGDDDTDRRMRALVALLFMLPSYLYK